MRRRACAWLALSSLAASWILLPATRPRYGGTLTLQLAGSFASFDPAEPADSKRDLISPLVFETLTVINPKGDPEPLLTSAWQRDPARRRWRFTLRPKVLFQDGKPLTATFAATGLQTALKKRYADVTVSGAGQTLVIQSESSLDDLPAELSLPGYAVVRKGDNGELIGTGPFRLDKWEPGRRASLAACEDYWGGRPFLDSVTVTLGSSPRQITAAAADIWELPINGARRVVPDAIRVWSSAPAELVAIAADRNVDPRISQALALVVDRASIVNVLAQRKGEVAGGFLPQWITGFAFLFPTASNPMRAKQLLAGMKTPTLALAYPPDDGFARSVAERISLNARDAGLTIQPAAGASGNLRLVRISLPSAHAGVDLAELAAAFGLARPAGAPSNSDALYESESAMLEQHRVVPLVWLPSVYGIGPRVRGWDTAQNRRVFPLHLESVWLAP